MFEELVAGSPCYGNGIGSVARSLDVAFAGVFSLLVWSNAGLSNRSNHVIGHKTIADRGQPGVWSYSIHTYIDPATSTTGQTGPEISMQNTRPIVGGTTTSIAGVQYIANPFFETAQWKVWDNGSWTTFMTQTIQSGAWYTVTLEADFNANAYTTFGLQGPGVDRIDDLSGFQIAEEERGFAEAFVVTLEGENLWNNCGAAGNFEYRVYYDQIALTQTNTKVYLPIVSK